MSNIVLYFHGDPPLHNPPGAATSVDMAKDLVAFGYAPGNYTCKCVTCGAEFVGDKRSARCQGCAERLRARYERSPPAEVRPSKPLAQRLRERATIREIEGGFSDAELFNEAATALLRQDEMD